MSRSKHLTRSIERAEFLWARAQMQAAAWSEIIEDAVNTYEEHKESVTEEGQQRVDEMITEQRKKIEEFVMKSKDEYLARLKEINE